MGGTGTWDASDTTHWSATSGGAGGQSVPIAADTVTLDGSSGGGTITVNTDFSVTSVTMGAFTGTLDFSVNNNSPTMQTFSYTGTGTRTLSMGNGTWSITGNNTTIWSGGTSTNLVFNANGATINCTYSGATGTRTFTGHNTAVGNMPNVKISAGTDTFGLGITVNAPAMDIDWTGFSGTASSVGGSPVFMGNYTSSGTMTYATSGQAFTYVGTTTKNFTSNGLVLVGKPLTINGTGTLQLADTLSINANLTLTAGGFNANNKNVTCASFSSSNSNIRSLTMGSGTWTLTGTGTVWNITTATNMTFLAGTSTILANNASASSKTFAFNAMTYNNLLLSGAGTGAFILGVSTVTTTFNNIAVDTPPHTVQVFAGKTLNVSSITWSGTVGNLNTFQSTTNGVAWNLVDTAGTNAQDYISLQDSNASGGALFYAGSHSTNGSGNSGWIFTDPIVAGQNAHHDQNRVTTLLGASAADGKSSLNVYVNPSNHALKVDDSTAGSDQGGINASRDQNFVPVIMATSSADGITAIEVYVSASTNALLVNSS